MGPIAKLITEVAVAAGELWHLYHNFEVLGDIATTRQLDAELKRYESMVCAGSDSIIEILPIRVYTPIPLF